MQLSDLLNCRAISNPHDIAIESSNEIVTFQQLNHRANQLANFLLRCGITQSDTVFIEISKSPKAIISVWATLKVGASFVPICPQLPRERVELILQNCRPGGLVCGSLDSSNVYSLAKTNSMHLKATISDSIHLIDHQGRVATWDALESESEELGAQVQMGASDRAYILHTSGSTGVPKGVEISHLAASAFITWAQGAFEVTEQSRLLCTSPLHFDLSIFDVFVSASAGAACVLMPQECLLFPQSGKQYLEEKRVSHLYTVPYFLTQLSQFAEFLGEDLPALKHLMFAGEPIPIKTLEVLKSKLRKLKFHNLYGPTETNVCSYYTVPFDSDEPSVELPVGIPASGARLYIVNEEHCEVAPEIQGEIAVVGDCVMDGYIGQPEETLKKIITITSRQGERVTNAYLTGDQGVLSSCGNIYFKGRDDDQIKRRGYRIELGEIRNAVGRIDCVSDFGLVSRKGPDSQVQILCFLTFMEEGIDLYSVIAQLAKTLPSYMMPDEYIPMNKIPRTSTGKIDKRTLIKFYDKE